MISGKLAYETLRANNMAAIPSLSVIDGYILRKKSYYIEGEIRANELLQYLVDLKLPKIVALSEDATRITGRVQYNSRSNDIIGFPLPIDKSGLPMPGIYMARCASVIEGFL